MSETRTDVLVGTVSVWPDELRMVTEVGVEVIELEAVDETSETGT
jgi:hypothetical protein